MVRQPRSRSVDWLWWATSSGELRPFLDHPDHDQQEVAREKSAVAVQLARLGDPLMDCLTEIAPNVLADAVWRLPNPTRTDTLRALRVPPARRPTATIAMHALNRLRRQTPSVRGYTAQVVTLPVLRVLLPTTLDTDSDELDGEILESLKTTTLTPDLVRLTALADWGFSCQAAALLRLALTEADLALPAWPADVIADIAAACRRFEDFCRDRMCGVTDPPSPLRTFDEALGHARAAADSVAAAVAAGRVPEEADLAILARVGPAAAEARGAVATLTGTDVDTLPEDRPGLADAITAHEAAVHARELAALARIRGLAGPATQTSALAELRRLAEELTDHDERWDAAERRCVVALVDLATLIDTIAADRDDGVDELAENVRPYLPDPTVVNAALRGRLAWGKALRSEGGGIEVEVGAAGAGAGGPHEAAETSGGGSASPGADVAADGGLGAGAYGGDPSVAEGAAQANGDGAEDGLATGSGDAADGRAGVAGSGAGSGVSGSGSGGSGSGSSGLGTVSVGVSGAVDGADAGADSGGVAAGVVAPDTSGAASGAASSEGRASLSSDGEPAESGQVGAGGVGGVGGEAGEASAGGEGSEDADAVAATAAAAADALGALIGRGDYAAAYPLTVAEPGRAAALRALAYATSARSDTGALAMSLRDELDGMAMREPSHDRATQLLIVAAAARAAVLCGHSTYGLLQEAASGLGDLPAVAALAKRVAAGSAQGLLGGTRNLGAMQALAEAEASAQACADAAAEALLHPRNLRFPRATSIAQLWWRPDDGLLGRLLRQAADNDRRVLDEVAEAQRRLTKHHELENRLAAVDEEFRHGKGHRLEGPARRRLLEYARESVETVGHWVDATRKVAETEADAEAWIAGPLTDLRHALLADRVDAERELARVVARTGDPITAGAAKAAADSLTATLNLLDGFPLTGPEPAPETVLAAAPTDSIAPVDRVVSADAATAGGSAASGSPVIAGASEVSETSGSHEDTGATEVTGATGVVEGDPESTAGGGGEGGALGGGRGIG
ncbi:hypothetical protein [Streptomyces sp. SID3343]|uniref:hypothetical protein n=1 Tax=Streptomyces sp. SID3343 TaxID=2690260 RepID=UPI00136C0E1F|nr:hypothetical protein [Streptomyces sp. SID3343]MYW02657.1 hypothetical protein [Streptomyces sp. SID3343]